MKTLLILLLGSLFYTSCAPGVGTSKLKVSVAAVTGSANFPGGLFFMGKNLDSQESFSLRVLSDNDTLEIELPNGKYNFYAIGWGANSGNYEGSIYCDVQNSVALEGGEFPIQMSASTSTCQQPLFNNNSSAASVNELKVQSCAGIKKHIDDGRDIIGMSLSCSNTGQLYAGGDLGFDLSVAEFGLGQVPKANFYSACKPLDGSSSGFKIPFGLLNELTIPVTFRSYSDAGCNTLSKGYIFEKGLNSNAFNNLAMADYTNGNVYLHRDLCNQIHQNGALGAFQRDSNRVTLVCIQSQLESLSSTGVYEIGKNITVSSFSTISSFSGQLRGAEDAGDIVIEGLDAPLFDTISTTSGEETRIKDLIFKDSQLNISTQGAANYGVLARSISGATNSKKIELRNLYFTNTNNINVTFTSNHNINVGIIAGEVNFASSSDQLEINNVHSKGSIIGDFSVAGTSTTSGGFFGTLDTTGSTIKILNSSVGTLYDKDWTDTSRAITLNGLEKTGGLIGYALGRGLGNDGGLYIRNTAVNVIAKPYSDDVGGFFGSAAQQIHIDDVYAHLKVEPQTNLENVGGLIGNVSAGGNIITRGANTKLKLISNSTSAIVNNVGGMVGIADQQGANAYYVSFLRSSSELNVLYNGENYGGLFGKFFDNGFIDASTDSPTCEACLVKGLIRNDSEIAANMNRGGLIGNSTRAIIKNSIVDMDVLEGDSQIGGAFGVNTYSLIKNAYLKVDDLFASNASNPVVSMIIGLEDKNGNFEAFENIITESTITVDGALDCSSDSCGILYGKLGNAYTGSALNFDSIINWGSINVTGAVCGEGTCSYSFSSINSASISSCSGVDNSNNDFDIVGPKCVLDFMNKWREYSSGEFRFGNFMDPLLIDNPQMWNEIGGSEFLSKMSFALTGDLPLGNGFTPLGNSVTFKGQLFGDGHTIGSGLTNMVNVTYGLVFNMKDAQIGEPGIPLIVDGFNLSCAAANCGIIQTAVGEARLSIQAKNVNVSSTSGYAGGLVGYLEEGTMLKISSSSFNGTVESTSSYAGGFVGKIYHSTSNIHTSIEDSFVASKRIKGDSGVGGFIGYLDGGGQEYLNIDSSMYLVQTNSSVDNLEDTTNNPGLIVGVMDSSNSSININHSFFDITNLTYASGAIEEVAYSYTTASLNKNSTYVIDRNSDFDNKLSNRPTTNIFNNHSGDAVELYNDLGGSWVIDNDRMKLWWML